MYVNNDLLSLPPEITVDVFTAHQKDETCDFEDGSCDSLLYHDDVARTEVKNVDKTSNTKFPLSDHTFGEGILSRNALQL